MLRNLSDEYRFDVLITIWPEFTDDGIIDPKDTRDVVGLGIAASMNVLIPESRWGVFRM